MFSLRYRLFKSYFFKGLTNAIDNCNGVFLITGVHYNRDKPVIPLGFASMIIQGLVTEYLFSFYARGEYTFTKAMKFGLLMGLFI